MLSVDFSKLEPLELVFGYLGNQGTEGGGMWVSLTPLSISLYSAVSSNYIR
jgi:hypothetical protein